MSQADCAAPAGPATGVAGPMDATGGTPSLAVLSDPAGHPLDLPAAFNH